MCRERDSLDLRRKAAEKFAKACAECADGIGVALHTLYDITVAEPIPDDLKQLVDRLQ